MTTAECNICEKTYSDAESLSLVRKYPNMPCSILRCQGSLIIKSEKKWFGTWPATCNFCGSYLPDERYFCDARSNDGHWGLFCPECHRDYCGGRLGTGCGQKYDSKTLEKIGG